MAHRWFGSSSHSIEYVKVMDDGASGPETGSAAGGSRHESGASLPVQSSSWRMLEREREREREREPSGSQYHISHGLACLDGRALSLYAHLCGATSKRTMRMPSKSADLWKTIFMLTWLLRYATSFTTEPSGKPGW